MAGTARPAHALFKALHRAQTRFCVGMTSAYLLAMSNRFTACDVCHLSYRVLHTGQVFGIGYRIAVGIVGIIVAVLSVTGVVIWFVKRRGRRMSMRHV